MLRIKLSLFTFILFSSSPSYAQTPQTENEYDFWLGEWRVTWLTKDGTKIEGTNIIETTLDGKVLQERFYDPSTNFKGTSISVYNPKTSIWHQAWADNQGGYYNFIGETIGDKKYFKTLPIYKKDSVIIKRMAFYNITEKTMKWDWESSIDDGKNWTLNWQIEYSKK